MEARISQNEMHSGKCSTCGQQSMSLTALKLKEGVIPLVCSNCLMLLAKAVKATSYGPAQVETKLSRD